MPLICYDREQLSKLRPKSLAKIRQANSILIVFPPTRSGKTTSAIASLRSAIVGMT